MSCHITNGLTAEDYARTDDAVAVYAAGSAAVIHSERVTTAERVADHAIGCSAHDLRDTELDPDAASVRRHLAAPST